MKEIKYLLLIGLITSICSCGDKFLDISPSTSLPDTEIISDIKDLNNFTNGCYNYLKLTSGAYGYYYDATFMFSGDLMGDDFRAGSTSWLSDYYSYTTTPYEVTTMIYSNLYNLAYASIKVFESAQSLEESEEKEEYLAEIRVLRALMYFDMVRMHAPLPSNWGKGRITDDPLGIYIAETIKEDISQPNYRNTAREVWKYIGTELEESVPHLSKTRQKGRLDWYAGRAFQARYYLYMENWTEALKAAKDIIDSKVFALYEIEEYKSVWTNTFTSESIFEVNVSETEPNQWVSLGTLVGGTRYQRIGTTTDFEELMQENPTDVRFSLYEWSQTYQYYHARWKWEGRNGNELITSPKIFRLSEMYLIAAEAALKSNDSNAGKYLSDLREKRTTVDPRKYDNGLTLDDILYERRLELACEGHRAWDLWRNCREVVRWRTPEEKLAKKHQDNLGVIPFDHFRRIWPISYTEIQLFPPADRTIQQNPGY